MNSVQNQNRSSLDHVPLVEGKVVDVFWDEGICWDANGLEHRLLPEAGTTFYSCECIDSNQDKNSFNRSRYYAESQGLCVVFVPGLNIESKEGWEVLAGVSSSGDGHLHPNRTMTVFHPMPRFCDAANMRTSREVFTASTPWSKSSPRGPL